MISGMIVSGSMTGSVHIPVVQESGNVRVCRDGERPNGFCTVRFSSNYPLSDGSKWIHAGGVLWINVVDDACEGFNDAVVGAIRDWAENTLRGSDDKKPEPGPVEQRRLPESGLVRVRLVWDCSSQKYRRANLGDIATRTVSVPFRTSRPAVDSNAWQELIDGIWARDLTIAHDPAFDFIAEDLREWKKKHSAPAAEEKPASDATSKPKLPDHGRVWVWVSLTRDGHSYRKAKIGEPVARQVNLFFRASKPSGLMSDAWREIISGIWVLDSTIENDPAFQLLVEEIGRWKAENLARNEYQGNGTPDAILEWLKKDRSKLSTDAATEIERLRSALLKIYEQSARNRWHVFSVIASDALNGKESKQQ